MRVLAACALLVGCHGGTNGAPVPTTKGSSALATFALHEPASSVVRSARAFALANGDARVVAVATGLETIAPRSADSTLRARIGGGESFEVTMRAIEARSVACSPSSDAREISCPDAWPGVDLAIVADDRRTEMFEVIRDARAVRDGHTRFAFAIGTAPGLAVRDDGGGRLAIVDKSGTARFLVPAPWALDARGVRRDAQARFHDGTLEIDLDVQGMRYPVLLDPGLEAATLVDKTPTPRPAALHLSFGFFDPITKRTMIAGGMSDSADTDSAWEWDGSSVTAMPKLVSPRRGAASVYARKRGVGLAFGGMGGSYYRGELVEWTGALWTETTVPSGTGPTARMTPAAAYDDKRDAMVLFGGYIVGYGTLTAYDDTWEHTPAGFIARTPTTKPPARWAAAMGHDMQRGVTVMFGGQAGTLAVNAPLADTWEWDGVNWKMITPAFSPPATAGASLVWDEVGKRLVLIGGNTTEVYAYDGVNWTRLTTSGLVRRLQGFWSYDPFRKTLLGYGGHTGAGIYGGSSTFGTILDSIVEWQLAPCVSSTECGGGSCVAGYCCSTVCAGSCQTCAPNGACKTLPAGTTPTDPTCLGKCTGGTSCPTGCTTDADCATGARCSSGTCVARKPLGASCTSSAECVSGACIDGFCCDRACGSACEACDIPGKAGVCTILPATSTPHGSRGCAGAGVCAGACNGASSACLYPGATVSCSTGGCVGDTLTVASVCDGTGTCPSYAPVKCAPYQCKSGACTTGCTTTSDCSASAYCTSAKCVPRKAEGSPCATNDECVGGTCASSGTCGPALDAGADTWVPDTFVPDTTVADSREPDVADTSTSDADLGVSETPAPKVSDPKVSGEFQRCTKASECSTGFCVEGVCCDTACTERCNSCALLTSPGKCTPEPEGVDLKSECGPANTCLGTCGRSGECIGSGAGTMCARNRCTGTSTGVGPAYCAAPGASCSTDDATPFECAPYACEPAFGACRTTCATSPECANGFVCEVGSKMCVVASAPAVDDGGCAMGRSSTRSSLAIALAAMVASLRRARRSRRSW